MPIESTGWLIGLAKVLSIAEITPAFLHAAATARTSTQRSVGLIGDSNQTIFVFGPITEAGFERIKKLEEELGMPLFARDLHDISLTEAGQGPDSSTRARCWRARDDAMRMLGSLKHLSTGTLNIASHESAAVYLLPAALRHYLRAFPDIKVGIYRSRLKDIPRQVMDREMHVGFVKEEPAVQGADLRARCMPTKWCWWPAPATRLRGALT